MGLFKRRRQQRDLAELGASVLRDEIAEIESQGATRLASWQAELSEVEARLAAIQAEFDGFPANGLLTSEIDELEQLREQLREQRWRLRGKIWLTVKPDSAPNTPPDDWDAGAAR